MQADFIQKSTSPNLVWNPVTTLDLWPGNCNKPHIVKTSSPIKKIAFIGSYTPRHCGIATFTRDLHRSINSLYPEIRNLIVAVSDKPGAYPYPDDVRFEIDQFDVSAYTRAADFITTNQVDVVCLQHEFGIFGGNKGDAVFGILNYIEAPLVTTLHTILEAPQDNYEEQTAQLCRCSSRIITMNRMGKEILISHYSVPESKVDIIPHGIPETQFYPSAYYKAKLHLDKHFILMTYGLLSPSKGIEYVIEALPEIVNKIPEVLYIVVGETHPNEREQHGEEYRDKLQSAVRQFGLDRNVIFLNKYVSSEELETYIGATDIYITPYLNVRQISSGTLSYCLGAGKAVISTPYWHAREIITKDNGIIVDFKNSEAICKEVINLYTNKNMLSKVSSNALKSGRSMGWSVVAGSYIESFTKAQSGQSFSFQRINTLYSDPTFLKLPEFNYNHFLLLTDSAGIIQHGKYALPNFSEGYCTDDNARAVLLLLTARKIDRYPSTFDRILYRTLGFINSAFNDQNNRFRNFMSYSRQWLDDTGSEDCHGRAVWALGSSAGFKTPFNIHGLACDLMERASKPLFTFEHPRACAFALLGIHCYLQYYKEDRYFRHIQDLLTERIYQLFREYASDDWPWCEETVTYDNARLAQVLLFSKDHAIVSIGLKALDWLLNIQTSDQGFFRPIGSNGFFKKGSAPASFDQQPIEAWSMISACIEAYKVTLDTSWIHRALTVFKWFTGLNDLGLEMYDHLTGGCHDGLQRNGVNQNEGAESTLSYLNSLAELYEAAHTFPQLSNILLT